MLKILRYLVISIYVVCGGLLLFFTLPQTGYKALSVATGSMTPLIPQGSLVVIHKVTPSHLHVGDVVTYINPQNTKQTITHRIAQIKNQGNIPGFITKGDANNAEDRPILGGNVVGLVGWHVPYVGRGLNFLHTPAGIIIFLVIPGLLIIIDEMRRLSVVLSRPDYQTAPATQKAVSEPVDRPQRPSEGTKPVVQAKPRQTRSMDGVKRVVAVILVAFVIGAHSTLALLTSTASLTGNTIATAVKSNHIVISQVFLGAAAGTASCPTFTGNNVTISNNGAGSTNSVVITNNCHVDISNSNHVTVTNSNSQSSTSGNVTSSGNVAGGSSSSGSASNSNSSSTTVVINNGTGSTSGSGQWFELHNPTTAAVTLTGWSVVDNSGTARTIPTLTIPAHGSVIVPASVLATQQIGNGLANASDRLILRNAASATVDGVSWGTDTSVLNPSLVPIPVGGSAKRTNPDFDTDTANDWLVQGP